MRHLPLLLLLTTLTTLAAPTPKYIFLFIGDGMSLPQRMTAEEVAKALGEPQLEMNHLPHQAVTTTRSANSLVTDSAASGTAIACGEKTYNGAIGLDQTGTNRLQSCAEVAKAAGRKIGILTTVTLNHATPAAFYGHQRNRGMGYELGLDLIASEFDLFAGGGISNHNNKHSPRYQGDIYLLAPSNGYTLVQDPNAFRALKPGCGKVLATLAKDALPYAIDRENQDIPLSEILQKAIDLLDNPNGFFIMTEGGKIDWQCHANDAATAARETIDLNQAVRTALAFASQHPDETLIIVTGDHETGGLTMGFAGTGYAIYPDRLLCQTCSRDQFMHQAKSVSNAEELRGLITRSFGLVYESGHKLSLTPAEQIQLDAARQRKDKPGENQPYVQDEGRLASCAIRIFNNKCGLAWTSGAHTALPVMTTAKGCGAEQFTGMMDNTDISRRIKALLQNR
ncbi:MAG: alkaline phosphatase [Kiritimatiellia bacterium]